ncbi:hypothetical protein [Burkholderia anthina]|uniref:hypothetical protein n=1 Tax=Burkholderia anthina TaxID=179879 RepID=UPI00158F4E4A|nr:hypothetical protein [Burkholderia anthina]
MHELAGQASQLEIKKREADLSAYVDEAIRQALRDQPHEPHNDLTVIYQRSHPIGSALADIFTHRAVRGGLPPSLIYVIEQLIGEPFRSETPEQEVRRGLLFGLCWQLTATLKMGGNGGFEFAGHDEGRMLMNGVRHGHSGDAAVVRAMTADDGDDPSRSYFKEQSSRGVRE